MRSVVGIIKNPQNATLHHGTAPADYVPFLLPESHRWWGRVLSFWTNANPVVQLKTITTRGFSGPVIGFHFLAQAQNEKGQISPRIGSGVTALAVTAALRHGIALDEGDWRRN